MVRSEWLQPIKQTLRQVQPKLQTTDMKNLTRVGPIPHNMHIGSSAANIVTIAMLEMTDFKKLKTGNPTIAFSIFSLKTMQATAIKMVATIVYSGSAPKYNKTRATGKLSN